MAMAGMLLLLVAALQAAPFFACTTHADCSFNGECLPTQDATNYEAGCRCYPQWQGQHCEQLNLIPTDRSLGYQPLNQHASTKTPMEFRNASTWGGQAIRHDDGTYHMWAAQMTVNCGIWAWMQNSEIYHATSTSPLGPYTPQDTAIPAEAHEPIVARAPTGEYVMWFSSGAAGPGGPRPVVGGKSCDCTTEAGIAACEYQRKQGTFPSFMSWSKDPNGPWSEPRAMTSVNKVLGPPQPNDSNFAGIIEKDGSVLAVSRAHLFNCAHWNDTDSCTATLVPHSGNGRVNHGDGGMTGEDPFIWTDPRNANLTSEYSVLHMLRHVGRDTRPGHWAGNNGGHQFSLDGGRSWSACIDNCTTAYSGRITFTDGTTGTFMMRERPHLVFAADGYTPLALTNGAAPGPNIKNAYSYTLLQKLQQ